MTRTVMLLPLCTVAWRVVKGPLLTEYSPPPIVIDDPALLRRVLVLYQLDLAATRARAAAPRSDAEAIHATAQR